MAAARSIRSNFRRQLLEEVLPFWECHVVQGLYQADRQLQAGVAGQRASTQWQDWGSLRAAQEKTHA